MQAATMNLLLRCKSIAETRAFYAGVLGFEVWDSAEGTCSARPAGRSESTLIFAAADNLGEAPRMSGTIYFFVDDVAVYYESVKDAACLAWPLQEMDYGTREFGITDCNGYHLAFAQD